MGEHFARNFWSELIWQKGQRAEKRAKELLGFQVDQVEPNTKIILDLSEGLNTGKLSKLIRWLIK